MELDQPKQPAPRDVDVVEAHEVTADLDVLSHALERGYVGRRFVPAASWATMMARLGALRSTRRTTVHTLCEGIAQAFDALHDGHLAARWRAPGAPRSTPCATEPERVPAVGPNFAEGEAGVWTARSDGQVGLLSIRSFPYHDDPLWAGFEDAARGLLVHPALIVDLRGNGGGDDTRGHWLAGLLLDGDAGAPRSWARQTPEALTLVLNYDAVQGDADVVRRRIVATRHARDRARAGELPEWKVEEARPVRIGPAAYGGRVAILVDAACASSCESTLHYLRLHAGARVFGERTKGDIRFGDIGLLALPHSRIRVTLATAFAYGEADEVTPADGDALAAARAWLAR